ncbi:hypothetical protein [Mycobacterium sp. 141]|nr:hypothetical protein [Mycobacterium sp. 141]
MSRREAAGGSRIGTVADKLEITGCCDATRTATVFAVDEQPAK